LQERYRISVAVVLFTRRQIGCLQVPSVGAAGTSSRMVLAAGLWTERTVGISLTGRTELRTRNVTMRRTGMRSQFLSWLIVFLIWAVGGAAADSDSLIFATGQGSDAIVAIDTTTDAVAGRYSVPGVPGPSMVAGELGRLVSVSRQTGAIHLFDVASGKALGVVEPGFVASEVRLSNDGRTLAAAGPGRVAIVDLAAPAVKAVIPIEGRPSALVFDRNAERLLIAHADAGRFDVADVARGDVVEAIDTGSVAGVVHLARTPGGSTAIAIDQKGVATLLDLAKWRVASRISLPGRH
jgi:hypothetical protein